MKAFKLHVTSPEQSREVQEILFERGYSWHGSGRQVSDTNREYLFADKWGRIRYTRSAREWHEADLPELKLN